MLYLVFRCVSSLNGLRASVASSRVSFHNGGDGQSQGGRDEHLSRQACQLIAVIVIVVTAMATAVVTGLIRGRPCIQTRRKLTSTGDV